ncbi:hypothetical protein P7K49_008462 [Saguinus oedipus]|uniref:Ig-like domain-containing protein n=1 Tax=Saguinus oedipus TaxID=9490 RepID=A0ABQ9VXT6_SAGOE|nr:hypothetical protein P7K49_008462 [Saguinus oedipus]
MPTVKILQSSCDSGHFPLTIQLLCLVSRYTLGDVNITWLQDGQVVDMNWTVSAPMLEGKLASRQSELILTQKRWLSDHTYTCLVDYQGDTFEESAKKCADSTPRGASAYVSPPSPLDLFVSKSPTITCLVVDLAPSQGTANLTWSRASKKPVPHARDPKAAEAEQWHGHHHVHPASGHQRLDRGGDLPLQGDPAPPAQGPRSVHDQDEWPACCPGSPCVCNARGAGEPGQAHPQLPDPELPAHGHLSYPWTLHPIVQWLHNGVALPPSWHSTTPPTGPRAPASSSSAAWR